MYQFFVSPDRIDLHRAVITGKDVNHIRNVLRMKQGDAVLVNDRRGNVYAGAIELIANDQVTVLLSGDKMENTELPVQVVLFQGLPKSDKMEWIIQKCTELGVSGIVPVETGRSVVKLDQKKAENKIKRWSSIAESAAKQSKRTMIPAILPVMTFRQTLNEASAFDVKLIPYENAEGMEFTRHCIGKIRPGDRVAVLIGPEGGFSEDEVSAAERAGFIPVTLGKRILRTETAGISILSMISFVLEP